MAAADVAANLDTAAVGDPYIEDGDIGTGARDAVERLGGRAGLAHDFQVVFGLEQLADAAADHLVVVEQEDLDDALLGHSLPIIE